MAHWIQQLFLIIFPVLTLLPLSLNAAESGIEGAIKNNDATDKPAPVLPSFMPKKTEPASAEAAIDNEVFELGVFAGVIAIEDFGHSSLIGVSTSFHATEDFFLQFNLGKAEGEETTAEYFFGDDDVNVISDRSYQYYDLLIGYNLFPGEAFIRQGLALNTSFYLTAGAGSTNFADEQHFTLTIGSGYRIIVTDWLSLAVDFRDHSFNQQIGAREKRVHNLEFSTSVSVFF